MSLASVLSNIEKLLGVSLSAAPTVRNLKVNVFCENEPATKVLDRLAELFLFEWQKSDIGYVLSYPRKVKLEQDALVEAELQVALGRLHDELSNMIKLSERPLPELEREYEQLKSDTALARDRGDTKTASDLLRKSGDLAVVVRMHQCYYFGKLMVGRGKGDDPLWQGEPLIASTNPAQGFLRLPSDAFGNTKSTPAQGTVDKTVLLSFLNPDDSTLSIAMEDVITPPAALPRRSLVTFHGAPRESVDAELANHPFRRRWDAWCTPLDSSQEPVLDRSLAPANAIGSPYINGIGAGELFESLFDRSKALIVTDSFRIKLLESGSDITAKTVREWLTRLQSGAGGIGRSYVRITGDSVLFRHHAFWRHQLQEPSTAAIESLEQKLETQKVLRIDDLAEIASKITDEQSAFFRIPDQVLTRFDAAFGRSLKALQFYNSLNVVQRSEIAGQGGLDMGSLTSDQSRLLWRAILETLGNTLAEGTPLDVLAAGLSGEVIRVAGRVSMKTAALGAEMEVTIPSYRVDATITIRSRDLKA